jgi:hypothetical protein
MTEAEQQRIANERLVNALKNLQVFSRRTGASSGS